MSTPQEKRPRTGAERMAEHRARMRKQGLVRRSIWSRDWTSPDFVAEARRQARAAANDAQEAEVNAWLDQVRDWPKD